MKISDIYSANDICIWMSPKHFINNPIPDKSIEYKDVFGNVIPVPTSFSLERSILADADLTTTRGQVAYNSLCGSMIISIFREEIITGTVRGLGLEILEAFKNVELALLAGALSEAIDLINYIDISDWWTEDMRIRYLSMCTSADAIIYKEG